MLILNYQTTLEEEEEEECWIPNKILTNLKL